jgi:hypothetical protein
LLCGIVETCNLFHKYPISVFVRIYEPKTYRL